MKEPSVNYDFVVEGFERFERAMSKSKAQGKRYSVILWHDGLYYLRYFKEENDRLKAELADLAYLALFHGIISRGRFTKLLHIDRADVDEKMAELAEAQ